MSTKFFQNKAMILFFVMLIFPMPLIFTVYVKEKFTQFDSKRIQNDPNARHILKQIERSKKTLKELQEGKTIPVSEHQKFIDEQRKIAQQYIQEKLGIVNKKSKEHTVKKAFSNFLTEINSVHQDIYGGQFNYTGGKICDAYDIVEKFVNDGGTKHNAYLPDIKLVSLPKEELVEVVNDLNVEYSFVDATTQRYFDKYWKLSQHKNDDGSCYGYSNEKLTGDDIEKN